MINVNVTFVLHLSLELVLGSVVGIVFLQNTIWPNLRYDLIESLQLAKDLEFRMNFDVWYLNKRNFGSKDPEEEVMYK